MLKGCISNDLEFDIHYTGPKTRIAELDRSIPNPQSFSDYPIRSSESFQPAISDP